MAKKKITDVAEIASIMSQLIEAIHLLGWSVAVPKSGDIVVGLIIGQNDYVESVQTALKKAKWKWKTPKAKKGK